MTTDIDIKLHLCRHIFPIFSVSVGRVLRYFLSKSGQLLICFSRSCRQAFSRTLQISQNSTASLHSSCFPVGNMGLSADIFSWMGGNGNENNKYLNNQNNNKKLYDRWHDPEIKLCSTCSVLRTWTTLHMDSITPDPIGSTLGESFPGLREILEHLTVKVSSKWAWTIYKASKEKLSFLVLVNI